jgi:hypothetical protein
MYPTAIQRAATIYFHHSKTPYAQHIKNNYILYVELGFPLKSMTVHTLKRFFLLSLSPVTP